jgi:LPXTG-motif cell wall-anchored protein
MQGSRKLLSILVSALLVTLTFPVSASADEDTNLLPGGSIRNSDGLIGLVGKPFFDEGESGYWSYDAGEIDEVTTGGTADCQDTWTSWALLCDPAPTTNQRGAITQFDENIGYTSSMDSPNSVSFIVVDLGQNSPFSSLEIYQMWDSDGVVTHVEMFVSSTLGDTWPVESDRSWTSVAGGIGQQAGEVALGAIQTGAAATAPNFLKNEAVTVFNFSEVSGRYVMFFFANDGRYENNQPDTAGYIEVAGVKLFGSAGNTGTTPTPTPTPTPTLATTGADLQWLTVVSLIALVAGASFLTVSRRKRTA